MTPTLEMVLALARQEAERLQSPHLGTEHVLLGLVKCNAAVTKPFLEAHGIGIREARNLVESVGGHFREAACVLCGRPSSHSVNQDRLCCECFVAAGHSPADWHPRCMAAWNRAKPDEPAVVPAGEPS